MWRPVVSVSEGEWMGLGFFLADAGATRLVGHTGEQAGFRSFLFFNPVTRAGIAGVVNTTNDARGDESGLAFLAALKAAQQTLR